MPWWVWMLLAWFAASCLLGPLVGKALKRLRERTTLPASPDITRWPQDSTDHDTNGSPAEHDRPPT